MHTAKTTLLALAIVALLCINAYSQPEKISEIGAPITKETAQRWINNFKIKHPNETFGHAYGKDALRRLLAPAAVHGLFIFNGLDGNGNVHLVFKAADQNGHVMDNGVAYNSGVTCPPFCDPPRGGGDAVASVGKQIAEGLAQQWIQNFKTNTTGRIFSHLYGKNLFDQVLAKNETHGIYFAYGLDDMGFEHLILIGLNEEAKFDWEPPYNSGVTCPPFCLESYPIVGVARNR